MPAQILFMFTRSISLFIWWISFYWALPRLQLNISYVAAILMATIITAAVWLLDQSILLYRTQPRRQVELKAMITARILASIVMAWVGGYAITLRIFWDTYKALRPSAHSRMHLLTFQKMVNNYSSVLYVMLAMVVVLFLLDNLGRLLSALVKKDMVAAEKEETIQEQEQVIQQQESLIIEKNQAIEEAHATQLKLIAAIQHELGGKLPVVKNTLGDLRMALMNLGQQVPGFSPDQKIRQRLPNESPDRVDSFSDLLNRMESALHFSISTVNNIRGIIVADPSRFQPEPIPLMSWLRMEMPGFIPANSQIEVSFEGDNPTLPIDRKQMSILLHNLVENAARHAFVHYPSPHNLLVRIDRAQGGYRLELHNNGHPLPAGFDELGYFQSGKYYGPTGHSGLGGYLAGLIALSHRAEAHIGPSQIPGFSTVFSLHFN